MSGGKEGGECVQVVVQQEAAWPEAKVSVPHAATSPQAGHTGGSRLPGQTRPRVGGPRNTQPYLGRRRPGLGGVEGRAWGGTNEQHAPPLAASPTPRRGQRCDLRTALGLARRDLHWCRLRWAEGEQDGMGQRREHG